MGSEEESIEIHGARTHNLRSIDLTVPRGKITVFTGVSGSGKSSLAFDTLFAEGQRRYIESLSPYVRRFLDQLPRPDVDEIVGLPPTLSVGQLQRPAGSNPRSTVATLTEILDHLRLLYARVGDVFCHQCGEPLGAQTLEQILDAVEQFDEGLHFHILAPLVRGRKGQHKDAFLLVRREGFLRARVDGVLTLVDSPQDLDPHKPHDIEMVVDRQIARPDMRERLTESFQAALKFGAGTVIVAHDSEEGEWVDHLFSTRFACLRCGISYRELEPRTFSFNSPYGACETCEGLGRRTEFDPERVVVDPSLSLIRGALVPFRTKSGGVPAAFRRELERWAEGCDWLDVPYGQLPDACRRELWEGGAGFTGVRERLEESQRKNADDDEDPLAEFRSDLPCPACKGARLGPIGRSVKIGGMALHELSALTVDAACEFIAALDFAEPKRPVSEPVVGQIASRLRFLRRVGVGYVELDRPVSSLSGGEAQRIRLAGCLGSGLNGVCYVLDEPSIGLHAVDAERLLEVLEELRDRDNTVLVVEHDEATIRKADHIVDLGPGAGPAGGNLVATGTLEQILGGSGLTAQYLNGQRRIARDAVIGGDSRGTETLSVGMTGDSSEAQSLSSRKGNREQAGPGAHAKQGRRKSLGTDGPRLSVRGARLHNLADLTVEIPLGRFVCVTGVSGSGKSSLVVETLAPAVRHALELGGPLPGEHDGLRGADSLTGIVEVDQNPIGRTPRSTPATYTGLLDPIRSVFARTREAKVRGYGAGRFSFNNKAAQCVECQGLGAKKLELQFLPDLFIDCPTCRGKRFNRATLEIKYRGKSIADVLNLTIGEAAGFFENHVSVARILSALSDVGLEYLRLGQWATTFSGGEAQRIKLATHLATPNAGPTLIILDEPTTGLHFHDIQRLVTVLDRLVDQGHTALVIEHDLDLIGCADWVIDLGPGGGAAGGLLVAQGPPDAIAACADSATGKALASRGR